MTQEEIDNKARKILGRFFPYTDSAGDAATSAEALKIRANGAKQCALIAVDEIIKTCNEIVQSKDCAPYYEESYWQKVKESINKL